MKAICSIQTFFLLSLIFFSSCNRSSQDLTDIKSVVTGQFQLHRILKGQHSSDQSSYITTEYREMKFIVKFDSSAIYKAVLPENQYDINKLYGFADNNSHHHAFSARIGWGWSDGALRLFGYVYNDSVRMSEELTTVRISEEHQCTIKIADNKYIFTVNGITKSMPRTSPAPVARGYKLFPYFGGDETAPHDVHILIKEY